MKNTKVTKEQRARDKATTERVIRCFVENADEVLKARNRKQIKIAMKSAEKNKTPLVPLGKVTALKIVADYWFQYYTKDLYCTLCGNSGTIDTTQTAINPVGKPVGRKQFCICPNGQWMRREDVLWNVIKRNCAV